MLDLNGGTLNLTATSTTKSVADAKPLEDGGTGESLGLGASVAMNLVDNVTEAMVETGATVSDGAAVKLAATGDHELATTATMSASGGTAITPVVAMTFTTNTTRAIFDTGSTVTVTGNIDAEATQDVDITTEGKGDAEGSGSLAIGAMFAFISASDVVTAQAAGTLTTTGGNVNLKSRSRNKSKSDSKASAAGASDKGKTVDQQADAQKGAAEDQGGSGSSKDTPSAKTSDGPIAIAAAVSVSVLDADISATVSGTISAPNGTVTISSLANQDSETVADGQATKAGSVGVGAAVAVGRLDVLNRAQVEDGGQSRADGITIEAGMRDVSGDKQHAFSTHAKSGAGSESGIGLAGALAITISTTDVRAGIATGGTVTLADGSDGNTDIGELKITAGEDAKNTAKSEPTVSGDDFGFGASVAFAIPTHRVTAEVEDDAVINGADDVTVLAKSNLETDSFAKAGVKAGVAISPVVAVSMVDTTTLARVGAGSTTLAGNLSITADHTGDSESHAAGSVESTDAAIGLSVAVTTTDDKEDARLERSITAGGNITSRPSACTTTAPTPRPRPRAPRTRTATTAARTSTRRRPTRPRPPPSSSRRTRPRPRPRTRRPHRRASPRSRSRPTKTCSVLTTRQSSTNRRSTSRKTRRPPPRCTGSPTPRGISSTTWTSRSGAPRTPRRTWSNRAPARPSSASSGSARRPRRSPPATGHRRKPTGGPRCGSPPPTR